MRYEHINKKSMAGEIVEETKRLDEGRKTIDINNRQTADIDRPHVIGQQTHAHLSGDRVVNQDGTRSHGGRPFQLTKDEAAALRRQKFDIPKNRLIESEEALVSVALEPRLLELLRRLQQSLD